jgi:phage recombination protein Bet
MSTAVANVSEPPGRSLLADMAGRYHMEPQKFAATLRATVVPKTASNEEFAAFLMVAKHYNLNPITKEIYAFPKQGGGIQPIVSVDGWANLINSHPQCDGFEFEDHLNDSGDLVSITCRMYRKDRSKTTTATEYMVECRRETSTWKQWPRRMLRHKALIQAARYAFGFAGIVDPDEAERFTTSPQRVRDVTPREEPPAPPQVAAIEPPKPAQATPAPQTAQPVDDVPSPMQDTDGFLRIITAKLMAAEAVEGLNEIWDRYVTPAEKDLFPTDVDDLVSVFRKRESELA